MNAISGIKASFDLKKLHKCADLIEFDGPLLTHYSTDNGDHYLMYWVDADEQCNRWLMARINLVTLQQYLKRECSLLYLLQSAEDTLLWVLDVEENAQCRQVWVTTLEALPADYLPASDALYDFDTSAAYISRLSDTYELSVPTTQRSKFNEFLHTMGLTPNFRRIAVL